MNSSVPFSIISIFPTTAPIALPDTEVMKSLFEFPLLSPSSLLFFPCVRGFLFFIESLKNVKTVAVLGLKAH